jgi:trans-AT polyketide synthase/acyltransferase/oxidoreductase domain-containing protein
MRALAASGVCRIVEVGPGSVLTKLWEVCAPDRAARPDTSVPTTVTVPARPTNRRAGAEHLGSREFRQEYGIKYAYLAGSMYRGIASTDLVIRMGEAVLMGFFGTGGLSLAAIEEAIRTIRSALGGRANFGMNLLHSIDRPDVEEATADLYLRHDIRFVEAAAYAGITPALVRFRFTGARRTRDGSPVAARKIVAKVSRRW